ncbi:MAG: ABC transporter substrate-binding protein [Tepidibacter sp.]|jgi:iron complex transport system substrate-binding protein|uniref:ABC transporter substrate-binding protein n=1 Tax=Tepidibacter sp. TaxID=2529387 RepID=UPI0025FB9EC8|nr:ABC transporter substrate-binding protein [Tepidibacter sp.]MCT4509351.1 ABC transporter substrate-binding protein [Tepidibacter sp.]
MLKYNNKIFLLLSCLIGILIFTGCSDTTRENSSDNKEYKISFVDDNNKQINMNEPAKKIISLYSAHTENLYKLGLDEEIIGVGNSDIYPTKVLEKKKFDYRNIDPEKIILEEPDLVLIRPFINRSCPDFVQSLEKAGINVVSLYPESFNEFDDYIKKLSFLTGTEDKANDLLKVFYTQIDNIKEKTKNIEDKVNVYFESSEKDYKTVTVDSMPGMAIDIAGGINIASDAKPIKQGSSIAAYGTERILEKADDIDVFVSQNGVMNAGGNKHSITIRPGFDTIKAIKNDRVYVINQKIISSPTFRYLDGINEMCRMFYPEIFDDYSEYNIDKEITREELAEIIVKFKHEPVFVPTSKYYRKEHKGHTYGMFEDVDINDEKINFIEAAVTSGYIDGFKENDKEFFYPEDNITREEFAKVLYMIDDIKPMDTKINISDISEVENKRIIQIIVDNKLMELKNNKFNPKSYITGKEIVKYLDLLSSIN